MNFFNTSSSSGTGENTPSPRKELQGPRPTALKVNKDSYKIRKPPPAPPNPHPHLPHPPPSDNNRQPVIIYAVSPKVIHTTASDFMNLVQRLTGNSAVSPTGGAVSPAARLASIEKTSSPSSYKDRELLVSNSFYDSGCNNNNNNNNNNVVSDDMMGVLLGDTEVMGRGGSSGILSPAPGSLPPISPGFFSPAFDPFSMFGNNSNSNVFLPSPSTLFSPLVSLSPSSSSNFDPFNPFFDF